MKPTPEMVQGVEVEARERFTGKADPAIHAMPGMPPSRQQGADHQGRRAHHEIAVEQKKVTGSRHAAQRRHRHRARPGPRPRFPGRRPAQGGRSPVVLLRPPFWSPSRTWIGACSWGATPLTSKLLIARASRSSGKSREDRSAEHLARSAELTAQGRRKCVSPSPIIVVHRETRLEGMVLNSLARVARPSFSSSRAAPSNVPGRWSEPGAPVGADALVSVPDTVDDYSALEDEDEVYRTALATLEGALKLEERVQLVHRSMFRRLISA